MPQPRSNRTVTSAPNGDVTASARSQVVPFPQRTVTLTALGLCALEKGAPQTVTYLRLKGAGLTHRSAFALASAGYDVQFIRADDLLALLGVS